MPQAGQGSPVRLLSRANHDTSAGTYAVMPELFLTMDHFIRDGKTVVACKVQYAANDIIYALYAYRGNLYAVMKKVLELREGLSLGGVRAPLPPVTGDDIFQIKKCAALIDAAISSTR